MPPFPLGQDNVGAWRSLVAHLHGVQGVEGSNPFAPTNYPKNIPNILRYCPQETADAAVLQPLLYLHGSVARLLICRAWAPFSTYRADFLFRLATKKLFLRLFIRRTVYHVKSKTYAISRR